MLAFLRRFRKSVLGSGSFRKYLPYALGEIILVVVGILLALQVNNWNQDRINKTREKLFLEEVHSDFLQNKEELETNIRNYSRVEAQARKIIALFPIDVNTVHLDSLASYFQDIDFNGSFDVSRGSIAALQGSASFDIISNDELRSLLLRFDDLLADYSEREYRSQLFVRDHFVPYLNARIPKPFHEGVQDRRTDLSFLNTIEFENLVKTRVEQIEPFIRLDSHGGRELAPAIERIIQLAEEEMD